MSRGSPKQLLLAALHGAALAGSVGDIEFVLRQGADPTGTDCWGRTVLHTVAISRPPVGAVGPCPCTGDAEGAARALIRAGAVDREDMLGLTAAAIARVAGYVKLAELCERRCSSCNKPCTQLCGGCKRSAYCGQECQRRDRPAHLAACGTLPT